MWKILRKDGKVLIDQIRRTKPIDNPHSAVVGIITLERVVSLFDSEEAALKYIADHNLVDCYAIEQGDKKRESGDGYGLGQPARQMP